jgi:disulfide bond formation protein DsbB
LISFELNKSIKLKNMNNKVVKQLISISHSRWYWLMYIAGGISMLAVALYHQYALNEPPCVLCIHTRLWVLLFVIVAIIGFFSRKTRVMNSFAHVSLAMIAAGLMYTSYQLLGTERGFFLGACNFDLGLPAWLAIEQWMPWLFRVETTCGYTPEVAFGVTMAP